MWVFFYCSPNPTTIYQTTNLNFLKSKTSFIKSDCSNNYEMIHSFRIGFLGSGVQNIFILYIFYLTIICFLQYPCLQLLRKNKHNIITVWWLSDDCPMTVWRLSDDCPTTARWLHDNCTMTARRLNDDCPTTARRLPDDCPTTARRLSGDCPMTEKF